MAKSIDREFDDLHFDCEIDRDGMEAAITLQRKLGSVTGHLELNDILDSRCDTSSPTRWAFANGTLPAESFGSGGRGIVAEIAMTRHEPFGSNPEATWHEEADVVVIGYGYAGAVAALEAHDAGADAS